MSSHVVPGVIHPDGRIEPRPYIVEVDTDGRVTAYSPFDGHEPPFTTPLYSLLRLADLTLTDSAGRD